MEPTKKRCKATPRHVDRINIPVRHSVAFLFSYERASINSASRDTHPTDGVLLLFSPLDGTRSTFQKQSREGVIIRYSKYVGPDQHAVDLFDVG